MKRLTNLLSTHRVPNHAKPAFLYHRTGLLDIKSNKAATYIGYFVGNAGFKLLDSCSGDKRKQHITNTMSVQQQRLQDAQASIALLNVQAGSTTTASLIADKQGVVTRTVRKLAEIKDREIKFIRSDLGNAQADFENRVLQAVPHKVRAWIDSLPNMDNAIAAEEAAIVHNIVILATAEMQKRVQRARDFITYLQQEL